MMAHQNEKALLSNSIKRFFTGKTMKIDYSIAIWNIHLSSYWFNNFWNLTRRSYLARQVNANDTNQID